MSGQFVRAWLPVPIAYYADREHLDLHGRGPWRSTLCRFHSDTHPSLRVNVDTGAFRCMACAAKGGDVLAFHMQLYGLTFVEAAKELGAWGDVR